MKTAIGHYVTDPHAVRLVADFHRRMAEKRNLTRSERDHHWRLADDAAGVARVLENTAVSP